MTAAAPIIGITTHSTTNRNGQVVVDLMEAYVRAVAGAGGVPILIPSWSESSGWEQLYGRMDGILFSGGGDISPEQFGGAPHPRVDDIDPGRDALELKLLRRAASDGKPFLGLCRGCQLMNVGFGGTLYTHIADQLPGALSHDQPGNMRSFLAHEVMLDAGTEVRGVMGEAVLKVNSHHHQGVQDIGTGLRVAGHSRDGLIEAIELPGHPFGMAVQWHPEWLTDQGPTLNLFRRFVEAAATTHPSVNPS